MNVHVGNVILLFVFLEGLVINEPVSSTSALYEYSARSNGDPYELNSKLIESISNFSIEILYHTYKAQGDKQKNLILSPIATWTMLAVTSEGAIGDTRYQIDNAIRLGFYFRDPAAFGTIANWLQPRTETIDLVKINAIFVDSNKSPLKDFSDTALKYDDTKFVAIDFKKREEASKIVNKVILRVTKGKIPKLVDSTDFSYSGMFLSSASRFKGELTYPFDRSNTKRSPFFNSEGQIIGAVNMMFKRHTYAFASIEKLKASVIELPYGNENHFSMLIMLPHPGVLLESMFSTFLHVSINYIFEELRLYREDYGDVEVDCFIPRFRIESDLDMTNTLKSSFGISNMFHEGEAKLMYMARLPLHVSRVVHKAQIEVTDEDTTAPGVAASDMKKRFSDVRFEANRPFTFIIIEKITNTILFGGFYREPSSQD